MLTTWRICIHSFMDLVNEICFWQKHQLADHITADASYYMSQVLECSWDELLHSVKHAEDLDQIIAAHQEFLDAITARSLLDSQSHVSLYVTVTAGTSLVQFTLRPLYFPAYIAAYYHLLCSSRVLFKTKLFSLTLCIKIQKLSKLKNFVDNLW